MRQPASPLLAWAASPITTSEDGAAVKTQTVLARTWLLPADDLVTVAPARPRRGRWALALASATAVAIAVGVAAALLVNRPLLDPDGSLAADSRMAKAVALLLPYVLRELAHYAEALRPVRKEVGAWAKPWRR
jgi:hypothetical protein